MIVNLQLFVMTPLGSPLRKQVLATKAEAERDGVKVPTTLAEYCVRTRAPAPDEGSDLFYDYCYDEDDVEGEDGDCCYDEDDSGNEESWRAFFRHPDLSWRVLPFLSLPGLPDILGLQPRKIGSFPPLNQHRAFFLSPLNASWRLKLMPCWGRLWPGKICTSTKVTSFFSFYHHLNPYFEEKKRKNITLTYPAEFLSPMYSVRCCGVKKTNKKPNCQQ